MISKNLVFLTLIVLSVIYFAYVVMYKKVEKFDDFYPDLENDTRFHSIQKTKHLVNKCGENFTTIDSSNKNIKDGKIIINKKGEKIPISKISVINNKNVFDEKIPYYVGMAKANSLNSIENFKYDMSMKM